MKGILGISAAVALILVQLAGLAAWRAEPAIDLTPIDGPELVNDRRA